MTSEERRQLQSEQQKQRRSAARRAERDEATRKVERMMSLACPKKRRYA
jgi:hypothetical protein